MHCEKARLLVSALVGNELLDDQALAVLERIESCPACVTPSLLSATIGSIYWGVLDLNPSKKGCRLARATSSTQAMCMTQAKYRNDPVRPLPQSCIA
jgi:hypothetical protein